jgi:hypothetical protein
MRERSSTWNTGDLNESWTNREYLNPLCGPEMRTKKLECWRMDQLLYLFVPRLHCTRTTKTSKLGISWMALLYWQSWRREDSFVQPGLRIAVQLDTQTVAALRMKAALLFRIQDWVQLDAVRREAAVEEPSQAAIRQTLLALIIWGEDVVYQTMFVKELAVSPRSYHLGTSS